VTRNSKPGAIGFMVLQWEQFKTLSEEQVEDKSGASTRGNSSSTSVY